MEKMSIHEVQKFLLKNPEWVGRKVGFKDLTPMHGEWIRHMVCGEGDYTLQAHRGSYKSSCLAVAIAIIMVVYPTRNIIFLRKLKEGGVAHSFGLHVARMAGMPKQVLESAEKTLAALETGEHFGAHASGEHGVPSVSLSASEGSPSKKKNTIKPHNIKEGRVESDGSIQLSFFQLEDPLLASLKEELDKADLNNMTPLQAFDLLRSMKEQLGI